MIWSFQPSPNSTSVYFIFNLVLTLERYTVLKGKFLYNAIEILPKASLESTTAVNSVKPEYFKKSSCDKGIGSGLYHISSYMSHSCAPNVEAVFEGSELKLVAKRDLKIGEEIFLSFVDVGLDLKDRRRILKEKYRFMCKCEACGTN